MLQMEPNKQHTALIISPLNALMENQIATLRKLGVTCIALHTHSKTDISSLHCSDYRLIFTSPEIALSSKFQSLLHAKLRKFICLVAMDEAHCITQWGQSTFRPDYANMADLIAVIPWAPVLILTATMTPDMKRDTLALLNITHYKTVAVSPDRPEIFLDVRKSSDTCLDWLVSELKTKKQLTDKTIVYCRSVNQVTLLFETLLEKLGQAMYTQSSSKREDNLLVEVYSAAVDESTKVRVLRLFSIESNLRVVISTVAFGMGIDIPDIRNVLLWGVPAGICEYWQQVGRACRDHGSGQTILFTHPVPTKLPVCKLLKEDMAPNSDVCYRSAILRRLWLPEMGQFPTKPAMCRKKCKETCQCRCCMCCTVCRKMCPCQMKQNQE